MQPSSISLQAFSTLSKMASSVVPASETRLFKPLKVGNNMLQHRIVFSPLTRFRNDDEHAPLPFMEKYYADRASAPGTLVISEATSISHVEEGQRNIPGFISDSQVDAWTKIINAVHNKGSFFFQQTWGMGRAAEVEYLVEKDFPYRSSSHVAMEGVNAKPVAMTKEDILNTIQSFVETSKRIVAAGAMVLRSMQRMGIFSTSSFPIRSINVPMNGAVRSRTGRG